MKTHTEYLTFKTWGAISGASADGNITKDIIYDAVAPDDFESMLELDRYNARSTAFDKIISATHDHFWDPLDKKYIDFDEPFDMENTMILPEDMVVSLQTKYVSDALKTQKDRVRFVNQFTLRTFSSILHGEQGALNLSASLCHVLKDQGAQEYAANQTREEARHVHRVELGAAVAVNEDRHWRGAIGEHGRLEFRLRQHAGGGRTCGKAAKTRGARHFNKICKFIGEGRQGALQAGNP